MSTLTATAFIRDLHTNGTEADRKRYEGFASGHKDTFIGVRMGTVFKLAKEYINMSLEEIENLLNSEYHEARVGAVSIMDFQARDKKTTEERLKELFDLYLRRHDRIDTWDLVDRSAIYVIGSYLADKEKDVLYKLASSKAPMERRTAIIATAYFMMKQKDVNDAMKISEVLVNDENEYVQKAVGWMLRVAGDVDPKSLHIFLEKYCTVMASPMLSYATEKLDKPTRNKYLSQRRNKK
jgi:3-methyladenine DNA glycosylase AlkD